MGMSNNLAIDSLYEKIADLMAENDYYMVIPQPFSKGLAIVHNETMDIILITVQTAEFQVMT